MQVPSFQHNREPRFDQAMTPMIDVVFLLLIFFVCASLGQVAESVMTVDLSSGDVESDVVNPEKTEPSWVTEVWVKLQWDDTQNRTRVEMNKRKLDSMDDLLKNLQSLAKLSSDSPVILDIGGKVPVGDVVRVDDACRAAGFQSINYATDPGKLKNRPGSR